MHFQIVPTTVCNARCCYCYENDCTFETMAPDVVDATVSFIKNKVLARKIKSFNIEWFGGEPLMVMKLIYSMAMEIIEFSSSHNIVVCSEIVTNATKIDKDVIELIKQMKISRVHISLDGMKDEYDKRKRYLDNRSHFFEVINAINQLHSSGIKVMLRINVDRQNIGSCENLIDYLAVEISHEIEVHVAPLYGSDKKYLDDKDVYKTMQYLQNKINSVGFKKSNKKSSSPGLCRYAQQRNYVIKPNGEIIHCEHLFDSKEAVIGTVFDTEINESLWMCDNCPHLRICKQGCVDENSINCNQCWRGSFHNKSKR